MRQIELKALAKINLGLDVLGRRENGYHDVRMVMQSIYLYDDVKIERTRRTGDRDRDESVLPAHGRGKYRVQSGGSSDPGI